MSGEFAISYDDLEKRRKTASAARKASCAPIAEPVHESEAMAAIHEIFNPSLKIPETTGPYRPPKAATPNDFVPKRDMDIRKLAELKEAFVLLDLDGDGLISKDDLKITFGALGNQASDEMVDEMLQEAKTPLDVDAFVELMSYRTVELDPEDVLMEAWSKWDLYGTGRIEEKNCLDYIEIFPHLRAPVVENSARPEFVFCNYSQSSVPVSAPLLRTTSLSPTSSRQHNINNILSDLLGVTPIGYISNVTSAFMKRTTAFIYSSHKILAIRIHFRKFLHNQSALSNWPLNIIGEYRFIRNNKFKNEGRLIKNTYCDYNFAADPLVKHNSVDMWRYFQSPRFPATYPTHIKCSYKFLGSSYGHVELVFEELQLPQQGKSCSLDKLVIYDSESSNANTVIDVLCQKPPFNSILSTGPDLLIEFDASSNFTAKGFRGKFRFRYNAFLLNGTNNTDKLSAFENGQMKSLEDTNYEQFYHENHKSNCKYVYDSQSSANGTFSTNQLFVNIANIHNKGPSTINLTRLKCIYEFKGRAEIQERVQIKFWHFNIPEDTKNSSTCSLNNSLQLLSHDGERNEVLELYCGAFLPKPIMSQGSHLVLQFIGQYATAEERKKKKISYYGFKAGYHFLTSAFVVNESGAKTSKCKNGLAPLSFTTLGRNCSFVYNSTDKKAGFFMSPNFPGLYPQNIICQYYFYGEMEQIIKLNFSFFDVEGVASCDYATSSDYVEFSNYISTDRKYPKYCGKRNKFIINSDDRFFRVTLYTNDRFERSGFRAYYEFQDKHIKDNTTLTSFMTSTMAPGKPLSVIFQLCNIVLMCLIK